MRSHLLVALLAMGCGETQLGPFQPLPVDTRFEVQGNDDVIHVARDRFGIAHVYATTYRDLGFGQGYVMAHDRLAQMELLRRFASGTLAELYGSSDPSTIAFDKEMRFHRLRRFSEEVWAQLELRSTERDRQVADLLEQFAEGVNASVADHAARWSPDPPTREPALPPLFAPANFTSWTPVDSIAILRLFTFAQSWTVPEELDLTELDVKVSRTFSATLARDLLSIQPIPKLGAPLATTPTGTAAAPSRPPIPDALFASARAFFTRTLTSDLAKILGPISFMRPFVGSNAFVIGVDYTREELTTPTAILAADMQLALSNPSAFYPMHQIVAGELPEDPFVHDVLGLMLPGVPVAIAGTNGAVGWVPTLGTHDVNDIYYEQLATVGGVQSSTHAGTNEPVGSFDETIRIGSFGEIIASEDVTYEVVPRHGPVIPGHPIDAALSIKYTGYAPTHELAILWELGNTAFDVATADLVLRQLHHGPSFMLVDARGGYAWTSNADVPSRTAEARAWSPASPDAAAPFFILDGRNPAHEWGTFLAFQELPFASALDPYIVVADDDPIDATTDGDPLNQPYLGIAYANGLRDERLRARIESAPLPLDIDGMLDIQHDSRSTFGERTKDEIARLLDEALPTLPAAQQAPVMLARDVLAQWNLETPVGAVAADSASAATLLFNTWMHYFIDAAIGDELATAGYPAPLDDDRAARVVYRLLIAPSTATQHPTTNEPLLCGNPGCKQLVVQAALSAIADLTADGSGPDDWRWGRRHALVMRPQFPDTSGTLLLPRPAESSVSFQLAGDMFSVDRSDGGWADTDFTPRQAVAYRLQLIGSPIEAPLVMRLELPTGSVFDTRDPHYRDLLDAGYLTHTPFDVPFQIDDINERGESRWEFR
jgi:penicillin amidase